MTYRETLDYLFSQLPMYQRIGKAAYKTDLDNTYALCELLGNPEKEFKSVHIAGTNGKGSTSHMIASVLQTTGYKTGLYTSPHLKDFRERIRINGVMVSEAEVVSFVKQFKHQFEKINLSFFEWTVGLAFHHFAKEKVDIAILETGMGGRLDSTNVVHPLISVITNIGYDHMQFLGNTLEEIAGEKAGIIKPNTPVVIGDDHSNLKPVFESKANPLSAPIHWVDHSTPTLPTDLKGSYQTRNVRTTIKTLDILSQQGYEINEADVKRGLLSVTQATGLKGRWQILSIDPKIICDVGHNEAGIKEIVMQLQEEEFQNLHMVFGMVNDKDPSNILNLLPKEATYYFCEANIPRAMPVEDLTQHAQHANLLGKPFECVAEALKEATTRAKKDDLIFVGGSTFVVAELELN